MQFPLKSDFGIPFFDLNSHRIFTVYSFAILFARPRVAMTQEKPCEGIWKKTIVILRKAMPPITTAVRRLRVWMMICQKQCCAIAGWYSIMIDLSACNIAIRFKKIKIISSLCVLFTGVYVILCNVRNIVINWWKTSGFYHLLIDRYHRIITAFTGFFWKN